MKKIPFLPVLLLIGGGIAWLVASYIVFRAFIHDDDHTPVPVPSPLPNPTLAAVISTPIPMPTLTPTITPAPVIPTSELLPTKPPLMSATPVPTLTPLAESVSAPAGCVPPEGWERYAVQPDDTLFAFVLGAGGTITVEDLIAANCLTSRYLLEGQMLFLPPGAAENAPSSAPAGPAVVGGATGPRTPACPCEIRIVEGWRREQIAEAINGAQTLFTGTDFLNVTGPGSSAPFEFVASRPAGTPMEGFLFPGTYTVQNDTTAEGFRDMLLAAFDANANAQIRADAAAQGVSFYQALIIASIVQRESRAPDVQRLVASVYYNRYRSGGKLGSTVPVQYALGGPGNWWPRVTYSNAEIDSPYNTYTHDGLPPSPVDNPGITAISAAVYPAQTNYFFHTAACDGSGEVFAETYDQHLANVNCE
jgi:hypothetical protein